MEKWAWTVQKISHYNCEEYNIVEYQWLKAYMLYIELREQSFSQFRYFVGFYCPVTDTVQYYYNHGLDCK